jgi:hypothetical protein
MSVSDTARINAIDTKPSGLTAGLLTAAAVLLGFALQLNNGFYDVAALSWMGGALCLVLTATLGRPHWQNAIGKRQLELLLCASVLGQLVAMYLARPGLYLEASAMSELAAFRAGVVVAAGLCLVGAFGGERLRAAWFAMLLAVHFCQGLWVIDATPNPAIDVFVVHKEAIAAIAGGHNPYAITFPNIYRDAAFYPSELVAGNRVLFGFPYLPLSLLLVAPSELLFGDVRYANLTAMTMAAAFIGYATAGRSAKFAAAVYLYTPRAFFVLEQAWTEPIVVLLLAMTVFFALRVPRWMFLPMGGLLVAKQYMVLAAPAVFLFTPNAATSKQLAALVRKTVAVALILTAPFVLWDPTAFLRSVVLAQIHEPIRFDSLSFLKNLAPYVPLSTLAMLSPLLAAVTAGLALWRLPRHPANGAAAVALVTFVLVAFGKKAFCNYYFFIIGGLACAIAALSQQIDEDAESDPIDSGALVASPNLPRQL